MEGLPWRPIRNDSVAIRRQVSNRMEKRKKKQQKLTVLASQLAAKRHIQVHVVQVQG